MRVRLSAAVLSMLAAAPACAERYYVRADGGSPEQCTGRADAPYTGGGDHQPCAWQHPFYALPPSGPSRFEGGDTLVIANGDYMMGLGAPGTEALPKCTGAAWDCHAAALPSGPSPDRPTRVLGAESESGCKHAPQLWGTQRAATVLDLRGSSNVEIACLEITDHSSCIEFHNGTPRERCERDRAPYGEWAAVGISASDSNNVNLHDVNIHGLAHDGVRAARLRDWTLQRVRINGNGWSGWNGDIGVDSSNDGRLVFRDVEIAWNGCGERFPCGEHFGCWGQEDGGYGDGLGTAETSGEWLFERVHAHHNTQDGLDLLHANAKTTVVFRDVHAQGNAGNQLKASGTVTVENSNVIGSCAALVAEGGLNEKDACRAQGNALSVHPPARARVQIHDNTIEGEGDCLIDLGCGERACQGTTINIVHNILHGSERKNSSARLSCSVWADANLHGAILNFENNELEGTRNASCPEKFTHCMPHN